MSETQQQIDLNGYVTIEKNPISRVGVFPYLGSSIAPDLIPDKVYMVYRPAEELSDPEAIASFRMVPLINDHIMLGAGHTPPEDKGVEGVTGEDVVFEDNVLYAPLKIFSETLKRLIASGKKALSLGYRVGEWERKAGIFNGQAYEFIQRKIRGNHIALVGEGRMGPGIAVLDHSWACDSFDIKVAEDETIPASDNKASPTSGNVKDAGQQKGANDMADEEKKEDAKEEKGATLDDVHAFMKDNLPMLKKIGDMMSKHMGSDEKGDTEEKSGDTTLDADEKKDDKKEEAKDADETEKKEEKGAMDAAIKDLNAKVDTLAGTTMKSVMTEITQRDKAAREVAAIVGTFDHSEMTTVDVHAYGLKKVNIEAPKGQEAAVWAGYVAGRAASAPTLGVALDAKPKADSLAAASLRDSQ